MIARPQNCFRMSWRSLSVRKKTFSDLEAKEITTLYGKGLGLDEIARRFGCSRPTLTFFLKNSGVEIALPGRAPLDEDDAEISKVRKRFKDVKEKYSSEKYDSGGKPHPRNVQWSLCVSKWGCVA